MPAEGGLEVKKPTPSSPGRRDGVSSRSAIRRNLDERRVAPAMIDETMSAAIRTIRDYTAARAWAAEILAVFVLFTAGRFGLAVWMFDAALAGAGVVPGGVPAAAAGTAGAGDAGAGPWWVAWLYAYDNLRAYAESAIIVGVGFAFVFEGGIMFLARKRIRLSKEEGREETRAELQPQLDAAVATATRAEAAAARSEAAAAQAEAATTQAQATAVQAEAAAQATAQMEAMKAENQLLRERQALRDEEIRFLRKRLAQRENGAGNGNDD